MENRTNVLVWNEFIHERENETVKAVYPEGIHATIAAFLGKEPDFAPSTATLGESEQGLGAERLEACDVLIWWGHIAHDKVRDEVVQRVQARVLEGMGLIVLHSAHFSKIFRALMGTHCSLKWREAGETERIWVVEPGHPVAAGLPEHFELPREEMYGERFDIPQPDSTVLISWFEGGEVFRSGCCWERGNGRVFYFRPGHETFPSYHDPLVQRVIANAVRWAAPRVRIPFDCPNVTTPLSPIQPRAEGPAKVGRLQDRGSLK